MSNWQLSDPIQATECFWVAEVCVLRLAISRTRPLSPALAAPAFSSGLPPPATGAWETLADHLVSSCPASVHLHPHPCPNYLLSHLGRFSNQQPLPEPGPRKGVVGVCERREERAEESGVGGEMKVRAKGCGGKREKGSHQLKRK